MIYFWVALLAVATLLYVLLDGFDLGVGILFAFAGEPNRRKMLSAISPVWDGNETWLVVTGTVLFGAFPPAYAALRSAFAGSGTWALRAGRSWQPSFRV